MVAPRPSGKDVTPWDDDPIVTSEGPDAPLDDDPLGELLEKAALDEPFATGTLDGPLAAEAPDARVVADICDEPSTAGVLA